MYQSWLCGYSTVLIVLLVDISRSGVKAFQNSWLVIFIIGALFASVSFASNQVMTICLSSGSDLVLVEFSELFWLMLSFSKLCRVPAAVVSLRVNRIRIITETNVKR